MLMVSYCDQSLSVVRALSTFCFKRLLLQKGQTDFEIILQEGYTDRYIYQTRNVTVCNKRPRRPLIMILIPGCDIEHSQAAKEPESCKGHKLSFCFTFLCDPDLGQRTLILIMTYHFIIVYIFMKSN